MPPRARVFDLPEDVRAELDARLVSSGFGNYRALSDWLSEQGYTIKKSALQSYGSAREDEFKRAFQSAQMMTQLAKSLVSANPDEQGALMEASERLAADGLIRLQLALSELDANGDALDPVELAEITPKITRAIADLNRSGVSRAKWQADVRRRSIEEAAAEAKKAGASGDTITRIRSLLETGA